MPHLRLQKEHGWFTSYGIAPSDSALRISPALFMPMVTIDFRQRGFACSEIPFQRLRQSTSSHNSLRRCSTAGRLFFGAVWVVSLLQITFSCITYLSNWLTVTQFTYFVFLGSFVYSVTEFSISGFTASRWIPDVFFFWWWYNLTHCLTLDVNVSYIQSSAANRDFGVGGILWHSQNSTCPSDGEAG